MNDKIELSQDELRNLINLARNQPQQQTKLKTVLVIESFLKNKRRHVRSLERYLQIFREFVAMYPELPTSSVEIDAFLSTIKGSDSNLATYYSIIRALYKFAFENLNYVDAMAKMHKPKIHHIEYRLRTPEELDRILAAAKPGKEITLCLVCLDSSCRIGALGRHETLPGQWYMGLHISNLGYNSFTVPAEKTGERTYTCLPEYINMMRDIANEEGYIFHSDRKSLHPSNTSKELSKLFTEIVKRAGVTGKKLGPHSFRHLGGSLIAQSTKSALAVKAKLGHDEIDTSMKYITEAEQKISQQISVAKLAGINLDYTRRKPKQNPLMIEATNPDGTTSTELVPFNPIETEIEKVEGIVDLSEELFPIIPDDLPRVHVYLTAKQLQRIRKIFVYYTKNAPNDGISGELASDMKNWVKFSKFKV
jgi:integrase